MAYPESHSDLSESLRLSAVAVRFRNNASVQPPACGMARRLVFAYRHADDILKQIARTKPFGE